MFAEELGGNASRKRAEEAKARRQRLLLQQRKKNASSKPTPTTTPMNPSPAAAAAALLSSPLPESSTSSSLACSALESSEPLAAPGSTHTSSSTFIRTTLSASNKTVIATTTATMSAVEQAAHQRQARAAVAHRTAAVRPIQARVRGIQSRQSTIVSWHARLAQQLQDVQTLQSMLLSSSMRNKKNNKNSTTAATTTPKPPSTVVVVPCDTATSLVSLFLALEKSTTAKTATEKRFHDNKTSGSSSHSSAAAAAVRVSLLLEQLLQAVILPGLEVASDESSPTRNALELWIAKTDNDNNTRSQQEVSVGSYRLRRFLNSLVRHFFYPAGPNSSSPTVGKPGTDSDSHGGSNSSSSSSSSKTILRCLRALLVGPTTTGTDLRFQCRAFLLFHETHPSSPPNTVAASADLVSSLRHYLLCLRDRPIPLDAEDKREACFNKEEDKNRAGAIMLLILDSMDDYTNSAVVEAEMAVGVAKATHTNDIFCTTSLQARVLKSILTIPLLTWRLPDAAIYRLVVEAPPILSDSPKYPLLIQIFQSFAKEFLGLINDGKIEVLLDSPDLPISRCSATGTQRLLANILMIARHIPACNGTVRTRNDFDIAASFFRFVALLVHAVPVGTFLSSRESAIAWIAVGDGNQKPIVLSPIILEQCRALLLDNFIRRVFLSASDTSVLETDSVLWTKNDKDLVHEKDLNDTGNSSASSLAAKEARANRNKSFWSTSKWARKLTKGVTSLLSPSDTSSSGAAPMALNTKVSIIRKPDQSDELRTAVAAGLLLDTSSLSRDLAQGSESSATNLSNEEKYFNRKAQYSTNLLLALTQTYSILLARWGGGGHDDIVAGSASKNRSNTGNLQVVAFPEAWTKTVLNALCFSTPIVRVLWGLIQSDETIVGEMYKLIDSDRSNYSLKSISGQPTFQISRTDQADIRPCSGQDGAATFYLFLCTFSHVLIITDDVEIHDMDRPLPMHQIRRCIQVLKKLLYRATCVDFNKMSLFSTEATQGKSDIFTVNYFGLALINASSRAMRDLYDRSSRRPICLPTLWIVPSLLEKEISQCKKFEDYQALLSSSPVLRVCPYMVSFKRRLQMFERIITTKRVEIQGENSSNPFHSNPLKAGIPVRITRGRLLEDGIATMNNLGTNMRQRIAVQYYNEAGTRESGIDAGGLFKEFWTDLCAIAFDPNYALFRVTDSNCLYPNPSSSAAHGAEHTTLFAFLGRILGKALFEGITIHPKFAHFFLSFLKGDYNFLHMLPDLSTVDLQLYNNLMFLKTYDGDASDLSLTFTVTVDDFGGTKEVPLMPKGATIDVTNSNKQHYIGLVAKFYVYDRIREQSEAMTRGLFEVVDRSWLRLFNEPELQVLISGASDGKIDVEDMKAHCQYAGGYSSLDRTVSKFWKVVSTMDEKQQGALLRFVTSCERAPPLGFGSMNPPFTILRVGILRDGDRLPTASTCFNVLKLPTYRSEKVLRERLLYAIESGAGFELT